MARSKKLNILTSKRQLFKTNSNQQLRLRIFAGPNGPGKSTIIDSTRRIKIGGKPIDFGYYINADEITKQLRGSNFNFSKFDLKVQPKEFYQFAISSNLLKSKNISENQFKSSYSLRSGLLKVKSERYIDRIAQVVADYLRNRLINAGKKLSFETVFSHHSKVDFMRLAQEKGYKVYLYFIATESPVINKFRVEAREKNGGHSVPPDKIESRYYKSLELLFEAAELADTAYFFDNSNHESALLFAHFKIEKGKKVWKNLDVNKAPLWFKRYYLSKM